MNKRSIADSNVLISYFTQDANYAEARKCLRVGVLINVGVLTEVINFIQNKYSVFYAHKALSEILTIPSRFTFMPADYDLLFKAENLMKRFIDNRLSFTDCFILAQAEKYGVSVLTSDTRMSNYDKVQVINPFS